MPTTAFVVVSQMRHREPFGDCPAGNFVVLELHPLLADRQPCPNPTSSCDQRSVRETLNGESVIHALLRPTQRYPVDAVRPTGGHLEHGDVAALVLGDGSLTGSSVPASRWAGQLSGSTVPRAFISSCARDEDPRVGQLVEQFRLQGYQTLRDRGWTGQNSGAVLGTHSCTPEPYFVASRGEVSPIRERGAASSDER
jgi:hypothetical protein